MGCGCSKKSVTTEKDVILIDTTKLPSESSEEFINKIKKEPEFNEFSGEFDKSEPKTTELDKVIDYGVKTLIFILMLFTLPFLMIAVVIMMFKHIVLSKKVDIVPAVSSLMKGLMKKAHVEQPDEEEDEEDEFNEADYELMDVESIAK